MNVKGMREDLINAPGYSSKTWTEKVKKMEDRQIVAVYFSFLKRGLFENKPKTQEQLSLF